MTFKIEHSKELRDSELLKWKKLVSKVFKDGVIPERKEFTDLSKIRKVLKIIGKSKASNHTFMPSSGGMDLEGCHKSAENDCIELDFGLINIVKPTKLIFQSFPDVPHEWSYFYLITNGLAPSGVYENNDKQYEELTEIRPNEYIDRSFADVGEYKGKSLPESARVVIRYFSGNFVIFSKASIYNHDDRINGYNAPHEKLGEKGFKDNIDALTKQMKKVNLF